MSWNWNDIISNAADAVTDYAEENPEAVSDYYEEQQAAPQQNTGYEYYPVQDDIGGYAPPQNQTYDYYPTGNYDDYSQSIGDITDFFFGGNDNFLPPEGAQDGMGTRARGNASGYGDTFTPQTDFTGPYAPEYYAPYSAPPAAPGEVDYNQMLQSGMNVANRTIAGAGKPQENDYWGNLGYALSDPFNEAAGKNDTANDFWQYAWNSAEGVAGSVLGGIGAAAKPVGTAVDQLADSNIPLIDPLATGYRWGFENIFEPVSNATPALLGTLSESIKTKNGEFSANPFDWQFDAGTARRNWEANDPEAVYQKIYQGLIAQGKSPQEAQARAEREREKMYNPLNRAFAGGAEEFGEFSPLVQLGVNLADPVGNTFGDFMLSGAPMKFRGKTISNPVAPMKLAGQAAGGLADVTGLSKLANKTGEILKSPEQLQANFDRQLTDSMQVIQDISDREGIPVSETIDQIVNQPDSPYYFQKLGISDDVAATLQAVQDAPNLTGVNKIDPTNPADLDTFFSDAEKNLIDISYDALGGKKTGDNPGKQYPTDKYVGDIAELKNRTNLFQDVAKETGQPLLVTLKDGTTAPLTFDKGFLVKDASQTIEVGVKLADGNIAKFGDIKNIVDPQGRQVFDVEKNLAKGQAQFDQSFNNAAAQPAPRKVLYNEKKINEPYLQAARADRITKFSEGDAYAEAARKLYGLQKKSYRLDGKIDNLTVRQSKPFEYLPRVIAAPLRAQGKLVGFMSNLYLNTSGRVFRDAAGNAVKFTVEGNSLLGWKKIESNYKRIFGENSLAEAGFENKGQSAEAGIKPGAKRGFVPSAFFLIANFPNEVGSAILNKVSKGKYKDFNQLSEDLETVFKKQLYMQTRLKDFNSRIDQAVKSGQLPPELAASMRDGELTPEQIKAFVSGTMPASASIEAAAAGKYHPTNVNINSADPRASQFAKVMNGEGGTFGNILNVAFDTIDEQLELYNTAARTDYVNNALKKYAQMYPDERINGKGGLSKATEKRLRKKFEKEAAALPDVTPEQLDPNHPFWGDFKEWVRNQFDAEFDQVYAAEKQDAALQSANLETVKQVLDYVGRTNNLNLFKSKLAQVIDEQTTGYANRYTKDIVTRKEEMLKAAEEKRQASLQQRQLAQLPRAYVDRVKAKYPDLTAKEILQKWEERNNNNKEKGIGQRAGEQPGLEQTAVTDQPGTAAGIKDIKATEAPIKPYPLDKIKLDANRFQYKAGADEKGSVKSLAGVSKWNPDLAGVMSVWKDPADGQVYIVNGHNRFDLANRATNKPQNVQVRFLQAKTAAEARALGAEINIAEGQGTAIDAAQYFRETGASPEDLRAKGLNVSKGTAKNGVALAGLNDNLWSATKLGYLPEEQAVVIGDRIKDPAVQQAVFDLIKKDNRFKKLNQEQFIELVETAKVDATVRNLGSQASFGGFDALGDLLERIKIASSLTTDLNRQFSAFSNAVKNQSALEAAGSKIDAEQARTNAATAKQIKERFAEFKTHPYFRSLIGKYAFEASQATDAAKPAIYQEAKAELRRVLSQDDKAFLAEVNNYEARQPTTQQPSQPATSPEIQTAPTAAQESQALIDAGQQDMFGGMFDQPQEVTPAPARNEPPAVTPSPISLPEVDLRRLREYQQEIYTNPAVVSPNAFQNSMLANVQKAGSKLTSQQLRRYFDDALILDEHIRDVTGNTFKLDLDTFSPQRISDGVYLQELVGGEKPQPIGTPVPQLPANMPTDLEGALAAIKDTFGEVSTTPFKDLDPDPEIARTKARLIMSEIARKMGFPDPEVSATATEKMSLEIGEANNVLDYFFQDMKDRYANSEQAKLSGQELNARAFEQQATDSARAETMAKEIEAMRQQMLLGTSESAYQKVASTFFDYSQKNVIDQITGTLLPFSYWPKKNFVYAVKYFAKHPMHFAAILNFYNELEQENKDLPPYARSNIYLWQNPDGSKVLWNFASVMPFNPLGSTESFMTVVTPEEEAAEGGAKVKNTQPLGELLWGKDKTSTYTDSKTGQKITRVTGREKGLIPSFFRPNLAIDLATKTGKPNEIMKSLGWVSDGFGSPDPSDARAQKMTSGLIPARGFYQEIGAATGLTQQLRKAGLPIADLDPEGFINEMLFGKNAGKPQTKIYNELTSMAQKGEISQEKAKLAIAAYKEGNWTPEALAALDRVQSENAGRRMLSLVGFQSSVINTPREVLAQKLREGAKEVKGQSGKTITIPFTGQKIFVDGESSKFYKDNPGASVLFSAGNTGQEIKQGLKNDSTREAMNNLYELQRDKRISARNFNIEVEKLQAANPEYFNEYPLKRDAADREYSEQYEQYQNIGGAKYDELQSQVSELMKGSKEDKQKAYAIQDSREYKQAKAARDQYLQDNPEFAKTYKDNLEAKYGPQKSVKSDAEKDYSDKLSNYYKIGGDKYTSLTEQAQKLSAAGDKKGAAAIYNSEEYKRAKSAREQFLLDNPEFGDQYQKEQEAKYGKKENKPVSPNATLSNSTQKSNYKPASNTYVGGYSAPKKPLPRAYSSTSNTTYKKPVQNYRATASNTQRNYNQQSYKISSGNRAVSYRPANRGAINYPTQQNYNSKYAPRITPANKGIGQPTNQFDLTPKKFTQDGRPIWNDQQIRTFLRMGIAPDKFLSYNSSSNSVTALGNNGTNTGQNPRAVATKSKRKYPRRAKRR